jgi:hypothetical protein
MSQTSTVAMCADVPYEFEVKNVQFGYVYLQKCTLQMPVGYGIKSGTSMIRWPNSGSLYYRYQIQFRFRAIDLCGM